jgi:hypothetical protein
LFRKLMRGHTSIIHPQKTKNPIRGGSDWALLPFKAIIGNNKLLDL